MKKNYYRPFSDSRVLVFLLVLLIGLFAGMICCAQNVTLQGTNFTQVVKIKTEGEVTKTKYTYTDAKGTVYPIYLTATGKAFIYKVSKKTGKEYKYYVSEIGKQINPEAYKKDPL